MKIHIIGGVNERAVKLVTDEVIGRGHDVTEIGGCDVALAPLLRQSITDEFIAQSKNGVLIFHPSLLPTRRGANAIKWAYHHGDNIAGVTWFWAVEKMDAGDICAQEAFPLDKSLTPREHYDSKVLPALMRTIRTALTEFEAGYFRRVPQVHENSTFDFKQFM